jgi:hypothetical protein
MTRPDMCLSQHAVRDIHVAGLEKEPVDGETVSKHAFGLICVRLYALDARASGRAGI